MPRIKSDNPDVIEYRQGGGCLLLFGLPFFLVGLFVMASIFLPDDIKPKDKDTGKPITAYFAIPFGGVFAAVGAALMFGRSGKKIDLGSREVTTWWGLLVPFRTKTHDLSSFDKVSIGREVRRSKNSSYTVYPVRLGGRDEVKIEEPRNADKARALAEELAKVLGMPIMDGSTGETVRREAGELDESLKDKARRTGETIAVGEPPLGMKSTFDLSGDRVVFDIPPVGFKPGHTLILLPSLIFPLIVIFVFLLPILNEDGMPLPVKCIFVGFLSVFFILLPILLPLGLVLKIMKMRARVEASPEALHVTMKGILSGKTKTIPAGELEELRLVGVRQQYSNRKRGFNFISIGGKLIMARSDTETLHFGHGLEGEELEWIRAVIHKVLAA